MFFYHPETKATYVFYPDSSEPNDVMMMHDLLGQGFIRPEDMVLVNPGGRIMDVETNEEIGKLLDLPEDQKFRIATEVQADKFHLDHKTKIEKYQIAARAKTAIYFQTVSGKGRGDGYGRSSAVLVDELTKLGIKIDEKFDDQKVGLIYHNPIPLAQLETDYRILMTMFESDKIPDEWKDHLSLADQIIVPSKWCADTFERAGFPATVVPLGYDEHTFKYIDRPPRRKFTFLHYDAFNVRKGFTEVFKAFTEEFGKDEPVRLIFKTVRETMPSEFPIMQSEYPNIEVIYGQLSEHDMVAILAESDCFVFPSRGEGFGMTPLEAMATGMPAIVPNAHGITEYFNDEYMIEVKIEGKTPAVYHRFKNIDVGEMVMCDVKDLRKKMRWAFENQAEAAEMGKKASEYAKGWTLQKSAELLADIISEAHDMAPKREVRDVLPVKKL